MPQFQQTLAQYRTATLRELRDAQMQYFDSLTDLDAWINEAVRWRDLWSGGSRAYEAAVPLTTGVDQYSLATLFPNDTVLDIVNLWLLWGNNRIPLSEGSLGEVTARTRPLVNYQNVPAMFCRYGASSLFIATAPSGQYSADFDVATLSGTLVAAGDTDPLPYPYTQPIAKYAAYLAKQNQRRFDEADIFYNEAVRALHDIEGARVGMLPTAVGR